jgi:hypothetical protein
MSTSNVGDAGINRGIDDGNEMLSLNMTVSGLDRVDERGGLIEDNLAVIAAIAFERHLFENVPRGAAIVYAQVGIEDQRDRGTIRAVLRLVVHEQLVKVLVYGLGHDIGSIT